MVVGGCVRKKIEAGVALTRSDYNLPMCGQGTDGGEIDVKAGGMFERKFLLGRISH